MLQEDERRDKLRVYERTIGNLMGEIGTLRQEVWIKLDWINVFFI